MRHITVMELAALLGTLPEGLHIAPSVGVATLLILDHEDSEIVGNIHLEGDVFVVELN